MTHDRKDGNVADKNSARTPKTLFEKLDARWKFGLDACADDENHLCDIYFTKEMDALEMPWGCVCINNMRMPAYCNCPYDNPEPFIKKGFEEAEHNDAVVVMLLPADTSTKAYHEYILGVSYDDLGNPVPNGKGAAEIIFIIPRVRFNNPDGTAMQSPKFGSIVVEFNKEKRNRNGLILSSMRWK